MKNKILALTILAFTSMNAMAQEEVNVTGKVVDKVGNPVSGAAVSVLGQPLTMVSTDVMGNFTISDTVFRQIIEYLAYQRMLSFGFRRRMMQKK